MQARKKRVCRIDPIATSNWSAYAAAAVASTFAAAPSAEATIHYSGLIDGKIVNTRVATVPLGSGAGSFVIQHSWGRYGSTSRSGNVKFYLHAGSPSVNGFITSRGPASVSNLNRGDAISGRPFI